MWGQLAGTSGDCGSCSFVLEAQMQSTVTGSVVWDSALILAKFLEHA